jgi:hypothetical protein
MTTHQKFNSNSIWEMPPETIWKFLYQIIIIKKVHEVQFHSEVSIDFEDIGDY